MKQESIVFMMVLLFLASVVENLLYNWSYLLQFSLAHPIINLGKDCKHYLSQVSRLILMGFACFKSFYG